MRYLADPVHASMHSFVSSSRRIGALVPAVALFAMGCATTRPAHDFRSHLDEIDAAQFGPAAHYAAPGEGKGGIQPDKVRYYVARSPLRIYRGYSHSKPERATGGWWTPEAPSGTMAGYRVHYEICTAWNPEMDALIACDLKVGSKIAIGPGASVDGPGNADLGCGAETYPDDDGTHVQVMLTRPVADQIERCEYSPAQWQDSQH
jgi:hypothetical protein